jgi:hypothetical protein
VLVTHALEVLDQPERRARAVDQRRPERHDFQAAFAAQVESHPLAFRLADAVRVAARDQRRFLGELGAAHVAVYRHRAEVHDAPHPGGGRGLDHVAGAVHVHAPRLGERRAAPRAVEHDVAAGDRIGQRLRMGHVAVHALHAVRPLAVGTVAERMPAERAHGDAPRAQHLDRARADEAGGTRHERARHLRLHAAVLR